MKTLFKHFIVSYFTARNLSKNQDIKKFFDIFIIRFFYAFSFIRNFFNRNNYNFQKIHSKEYFKKNITNEKVLKDLNSAGYNDFLNLKKKYLNEIKKFYDNKNIKTFKGKEGKVIIEDTFGLHKGTPPSSKSRIMLILIYGHGPGINNYKNLLIKKFKS